MSHPSVFSFSIAKVGKDFESSKRFERKMITWTAILRSFIFLSCLIGAKIMIMREVAAW